MFPFEHLGEVIQVSQWQSVTAERSTKDDKAQKDFRITKKITESRTLTDAMDILMKQLETFSVHNYTNITQLHKFQCQKNNLKPGEIIISKDVSENYLIKHQDEIMSAHWSTEAITLFCATAHYLDGNNQKQMEHYILCSGDLGHDKNSIYFYNKQIIADLQQKGVTTQHIHYWSDGPSSQFKNKFNATNLKFQLHDYGISADWNFFATAHGKGENDGSGGDVKNGVWRKVLQKMVVVANLDVFVMVAQAKFTKFNIFSFTKEKVTSLEDFLNQRYLFAKPISNLNAMHFLRIEDGAICGDLVSPSCLCHSSQKVFQKPSNSLSVTVPIVGKFYYVNYAFVKSKGGEESRNLPAICSKSTEQDHWFAFLQLVLSTKDGYIYKIDQDDVSLVNQENIVDKVIDPITIDKTTFSRRRVQYK